MHATVLETLPNARFRVALPDGNEVLAHVSGDMRMQVIRILPGDRVHVEVSPFDRNLARITRKPDAGDRRIPGKRGPFSRPNDQTEDDK